ncbi:Ff.00g112750.m01.CDS01 [Fusarium sp. VM40]|nr:Ff.00g112750.m01.CDS01 [Fusarium sp. VM40]
MESGLGSNNSPDRLPWAKITEGTPFDSFVIGQRIGLTEHADIYAVSQQNKPDTDANITYEARSYSFLDIEPNVKANRARAVRRMSQRTILNTTWQDLQVIIYRTGDVQNCKKHDPEETTGPVPSTIPDIPPSDRKPKEKTTRRRESNRLRQKSRRERTRKQNRLGEGASQDETELAKYQDDEESPVTPKDPIEVDGSFVFFELLYLANGDEQSRKELPPTTRFQLERYIEAREEEVVLDDEDALDNFISIKEREIVSLRRTLNQYQPVLSNWHTHLEYALRQRLIGSTELQGQNIPLFLKRYKILKSGLDALPGLITKAETTVQSLRPRLLDARKARESRDAKQARRLRKKKLEKTIKNYNRWTSNVTIGSASYYKIGEDISCVEQELERLTLESLN